MIKRYSIYFAFVAAAVVFGLGMWVGVSFDTLVLRTFLVFVGFYVLGNLLGVITIEALLENQIQKVKRQSDAKKHNSAVEE